MKRFVCLFLILLLLPVLSFSEDDPYVGIWINDTPSGMASRVIVTYHVDSSGTVFYSRQEHFFDGSPAKVDTCVYSSERTDQSILIKDGDQVVKELYYVNKYQLSSDPRKTYGFYNRVLKSNNDYQAAVSYEDAAIKKAEEEKEKRIQEAQQFLSDPCGKWTYVLEASDADYSRLSYSYLSIDLYLFSDGSAYMFLGTKDKKTSALDIKYSDGMWLGDSSLFRVKTKDEVFTGRLDENGSLLFQFSENVIFRFVRSIPESFISGTV